MRTVFTWCTLVSRHNEKTSERKINPVKHSLRQASCSAAHTITHAWPSRLNLANFSLIWQGQSVKQRTGAPTQLRFLNGLVFYVGPTRDVPCHGLDEQLPQRRVQRR